MGCGHDADRFAMALLQVGDPVLAWANLAGGYIAQRWPRANRPLIVPTVAVSIARHQQQTPAHSLIGVSEPESRQVVGGAARTERGTRSEQPAPIMRSTTPAKHHFDPGVQVIGT